jgi:cytochrome P450
MLERLPVLGRRRPIVDIGPGELYANPYPWYRRLRHELPIAYAPHLRHYAAAKDAYWLVTRWDHVVEVLKDETTFVAPPEPPGAPATLRGTVFLTEGPEHERVRSAALPACRPRAAAAFADDVVLPLVDELLDAIEPEGTAELVDDVFEPLAAVAMARFLGIGEVPVADLRAWFDYIGGYFTGEVVPKAGPLDEQIDAVLLDRLHRTRPDEGTLLAALGAWRDDAGTLDENRILANAKIFGNAGMHELTGLLGHAVLGLLSRPEHLAELRADASLARPAVEEAGRWGCPVGMIPRVTTTPAELGGVRIPAGAYVSAVIASANRDEQRFTQADRFDLHRDEGMHLAFGTGTHFCPGAWIGRAAAAVTLRRLFERLPELELTEGDRLIVTGWRLRDVRRLSVSWS